MAGLSEREIRALERLEPEDFPWREWAALSWVRTFMENGGKVPEEVERVFYEALNERERACVLASHKAMFVSNLTANTMQGLIDRLRGKEKDASACRISL